MTPRTRPSTPEPRLRRALRAALHATAVGALVLGLLAALAPTATASATGRTGATRVVPRERPPQEPSAVFARSSYLCYGYADCKAKGMGNAGYAQNNRTMYWRMYSGHNCTNYAAYRMVHSGMPNVRPWSGPGNATYWGGSMPRITDGTPHVGAVAWWRANTGPAGSAGHVAYVEKVVDSDEIVVSQDSWGGDFSWAVITKASGNWPSGFIHFNDIALTNKQAPVVSGTAKVGSVLSSTAGTWQPADVAVAYQWFADGVALPRATKATLQLTRARVDQRISVTVTATQPGFPAAKASSSPTSPVLPGQLRNVSEPMVSGTAKVESTLTLDPGTWNPEPTLGYQWYADGDPIDGATGTTLVLGPDLAGRAVTARVTATRPGYAPVSATSATTGPVAPGTIRVRRAPVLTGTGEPAGSPAASPDSGTPEITADPGGTLTVDPGGFRPTDAAATVQWLRDGQPVLNATGTTYQVTGLDLGARISAEVTVARAGYQSRTLPTAQTEVVRATPDLRVRVDRLHSGLRAVVRVTAADVPDVSGRLVVRVAGVRRVVDLVHGAARLRLTGLREGERLLKVVYRGSDITTRVVLRQHVVVG